MTITEVKKESENCCTCKHDKRFKEKDIIVCRCDIDGHYIGYFECFKRLCDNCEMYEWQKGGGI